MIRDVFLCHASEDKQHVVRPLNDALRAAGISCWLDEAEIHWGDSIVSKVNDGLRDSRFVIVVLSVTFLKKPWPRRELASAVSDESSSGHVRVLPLLVGDQRERETIMMQLPLLRDKLHIAWEGDATPVVEAVRRRIHGFDSSKPHEEHIVPGAEAHVTFCTRCGAKTGRPSDCPGYTSHAFVAGTGREYCTRCGATAGFPSQCPGYTSHAFVAGTGREYCTRCGAKTGRSSECPGYTSHAFVAGTGGEYCTRCGATAGFPSQCPGHTSHAFRSGH
jgi:TIR domain-containing protein